MINKINGQHYQNLIDYGIRNLSRYCDKVNALNVFPVPDGDTGTNMVMTLQNGFSAIDGLSDELNFLAKRFAKAVVFGARGNSGVIVSQFFKGFSECFFTVDVADCKDFVSALENGVTNAYKAVSNPVEGTVLTVLREATEYIKEEVKSGKVFDNLNDVIRTFLDKARVSLKNTPELLPILKSAGVVDSGAAGIVYVFEGMSKYLNNEPIEKSEPLNDSTYIDYSVYDKKSTFEFGYCTELLIQLTEDKADFDYNVFKNEIEAFGDSVVTALENDKVKLHIHSFTPEKVLEYCHKYGEFLSLKIENMTVEHNETESNIFVSSGAKCENFSIVSVAFDSAIKDTFLNMGSDVVILGEPSCPPSSSDFINAFDSAQSQVILVFPNSKNTELVAKQAEKLYDKSKIIVFDTKSVAECYSALSMIDFDEPDVNVVADTVRKTVDNIYTLIVAKVDKSTTFNGIKINEGDFVAVNGNYVFSVGKDVCALSADLIKKVLNNNEKDIVNIFVGKNVDEKTVENITEFLDKNYIFTDYDVIKTDSESFKLLFAFE